VDIHSYTSSSNQLTLSGDSPNRGKIELPLHEKVRGVVEQHSITYWNEPRPEEELKPVVFQGKTLYVQEQALRDYGMHHVVDQPDTFEAALNKTKMWMQGFSLEFTRDLSDRTKLGTILSTLHQHAEIIETKEFSAVPISSQETFLVHQVNAETTTIDKITSAAFAQGGFAAIHKAGPLWAVRRLQDNSASQTTLSHTQKTLQKIHRQPNVLGVEPPPKDVTFIDPHSSASVAKTVISVSTLALGDCFDLLHETKSMSTKDKPLVAYHITQGLKACVDAQIAHTDIKTENILCYGTKEPGKQAELVAAKLIDFDDAMDLESKEHYLKHPANTVEPSSVYRKDIIQLAKLRKQVMTSNINADFEAFRKLAYQVSVCEMGATLFELYTGRKVPARRDRDGCILEINDERVAQTLHDSPALNATQREMIYNMLHPDAEQRPAATAVAEVFSLRSSNESRL